MDATWVKEIKFEYIVRDGDGAQRMQKICRLRSDGRAFYKVIECDDSYEANEGNIERSFAECAKKPGSETVLTIEQFEAYVAWDQKMSEEIYDTAKQ